MYASNKLGSVKARSQDIYRIALGNLLFIAAQGIFAV